MVKQLWDTCNHVHSIDNVLDARKVVDNEDQFIDNVAIEDSTEYNAEKYTWGLKMTKTYLS